MLTFPKALNTEQGILENLKLADIIYNCIRKYLEFSLQQAIETVELVFSITLTKTRRLGFYPIQLSSQRRGLASEIVAQALPRGIPPYMKARLRLPHCYGWFFLVSP